MLYLAEVSKIFLRPRLPDWPGPKGDLPRLQLPRCSDL